MKPEHQRQQLPLTVALRVRPMSNAEYNTGAKQIAHAVDKHLVVLQDPEDNNDDILRVNRSRERQFAFDQTFQPMSSQTEVYHHTVTASGLIPSIVQGFNITVFAYGATGAGKTYTMLGTDREPGIMVLTLNDLFTKIEETREDTIYRVTMAYLEIYNEMIRDLLNPSSGILELREDASGSMVVVGLLEVETTSTPEVMKLLRVGNLRRTSEPTAVNKTSSRSHAILKVMVEQRSRVMGVTQEVRTGVLFMVDLAGSERAAITQNRGKRMIEGAHINRSLLALGNCINALVGNVRPQFVNYRDSKLTRLLKDSLGGNCRTVMIAHISPASVCFEESRNTLNYAERARCIKTRVHQNVTDVSYHITQYHTIIAELRRKVVRLQEQLASAREQLGAREGDVRSPAMEELCGQLKTLSQDEMEIRQELLVIECHLLQNGLERQRHMACIREWEQKRASLSTPAHSSNTLSRPPTLEKAHLTNEASDTAHVTRENAIIVPGSIGACVSPDSGTELSSVPLMEPVDVSSAREELATLVADKQRMEAQHKRLERRLQENRAKVAGIHEYLSSLPVLPPLLRELVDLLQWSSELEATSLEHSLTAALSGIQLARRENTVEEAMRQNTLLMELVEHQKTLMEEHSVAQPVDLGVQYCEAVARQRALVSQVAVERQLLLPGRELQLPSLARLSAKLYTAMTGSKSNLLLDDTATENGDTEIQTIPSRGHTPPTPTGVSDIHLPTIANSPLPNVHSSLRHLHHQPSSLSLPPISPHHSLVARSTVQEGATQPETRRNGLHSSSDTSTSSKDVHFVTSNKSTLFQKVDILPTITNPSTEGKTHEVPPVESARASNSIISPRSRLALLSKVSSFTTPRITVSRSSSNKSKYIVSNSRRDTLVGENSKKGRVGKSQSQPHLLVRNQGAKAPGRRGLVRGSTLPFAKPLLSESTRRKLRESRTVITIEELEALSSNSSTLLHRTGSNATVHNARTKQPVIPVAKGIAKGEVVKRKPPVPPLPKKRALPRQELMLAKVNAGSQFSNIHMGSPYLTPVRHPRTTNRQGQRRRVQATRSLQKTQGKAAKPKR